jgi:hypothetical protein
VVVARDAIHTTVDGRRFLITHGDEFDGVVQHARWLAFLGDWAYRTILALNTLFNHARRKMGFGYWSLSAFLKSRVKNALQFVENFEGAVAEEARRRGVDGMLVSNTTVSRPAGLADPAATETGGLSGRPLYPLSTRVLAATFLRVDGAFPLVGVGGVDSPQAALGKIEAGATLVQLYSALVYEGPGLVGRILDGLVEALPRGRDARLADRIGARARDLAGELA